MTTRIRYKKELDGTLVTKIFKTPNNEVHGIIEPNGKIFIQSLDGKIFQQSEEHYTNLQNAKKVLKKALISLGCNFQEEVRPQIKDHINEAAKKQYESENMGDK